MSGGRGGPFAGDRGGRLGGGLEGALGGGGSMSPIVMALMALLASRGGGGLGGMLGGSGAGGGLGGMLGGLLGHGDARPGVDPRSGGGDDLAGAFDNSGRQGSATGGGFGGEDSSGSGRGLGGLLERFTQSGHGDKIDSWVGPGENAPIAPEELDQALGPDTVDTLSRQTGMPKGDLLSQLSQVLPGVVDNLTPQGRMPEREEMERW